MNYFRIIILFYNIFSFSITFQSCRIMPISLGLYSKFHLTTLLTARQLQSKYWWLGKCPGCQKSLKKNNFKIFKRSKKNLHECLYLKAKRFHLVIVGKYHFLVTWGLGVHCLALHLFFLTYSFLLTGLATTHAWFLFISLS